ncbi:MAG: MIP/aquaporin family protein [Galactobacter sp.]
MTDISLGQAFLSEFIGTSLLILLGAGVVANVLLKKSKGEGGGTLMINFGWGIAVFVGVYAAFASGGQLNPAVTLAKVVAGQDLAPGLEASFGNVLALMAAQLLGAIVGAILCWLAYKQHFDQHDVAADKLGVFATGPAIRSYGWNLVTEILGTFVLVVMALASGYTETAVGPLFIAFVVVGIGASLGGPTGYAINPARDLGPRIAHAILPIKGKGSSDWSYSWVPVVGPLVGGVLGALVYLGYVGVFGEPAAFLAGN